MISDAEIGVPRDLAKRTFDTCVVGSGPAGLCVALHLARTGRSVALMEGGGLEISPESQDLYDGDIVGDAYYPLTATRLRYFGGSSNHWGGMCRPLDPWDFRRHEHHPLSGWPITKADLDLFADAANAFLGIVPEETPRPGVFAAAHDPLRRFVIRWPLELRLAKRYRPEVAKSGRIELCLHANLVDIELDSALDRVRRLVFRTLGGSGPFTVQARQYVLALGGLENPRMLLNANRQVPEGVGNRHGVVGRFFCEHPHQTVGSVLLARPIKGWQFYQPSLEFIKEQKTLNFGLRLVPAASRLDLHEAVINELACNSNVARRIFNLMGVDHVHCEDGDLDLYAKEGADPSIMLTARLDIAMEQALNPDSRIRLGTKTDRFGLRRIELDWHHSKLDAHTARTAALVFGKLLADQNVGRLRLAEWLLGQPIDFPGFESAEVGGHHHMCTTRMSDDPKTGVVDRNCRVHGIDNLYLAGSSVFATTGHINPTYTIVQLAARLANHLSKQTLPT
jgi:choline dehydrogenase-like flavoprotein